MTGYDIFILERNLDKLNLIKIKELERIPMQQYDIFPDRTINVPTEAIRNFINELQSIGMLPTVSSAVQEHLKDLQRLLGLDQTKLEVDISVRSLS